MKLKLTLRNAGTLTALLVSLGAQAFTITEDFTGATTSNSWTAINGACLTAGSQTTSTTTSSYIPACKGLAYYGTQTQVGLTNNADPVGHGALRFTNGYPYGGENGGIFLNQVFPSNAGLQATFTSYTYGGNGGGTAKLGADGMGFYILNGIQAANLGDWGGSLGYDCSNTNNSAGQGFSGMINAYLGLGIDEYGNFSNHGDNSATGPGASPNSVVLRGYGDVNINWLENNYPSNYPTTKPASYTGSTTNWLSAVNYGVQATCKTGYVQNYSVSGSTVTWSSTSTTVPDYAFIAHSQLPLSSCPPGGASTLTPGTTSSYPNCQPIANQQGTSSTPPPSGTDRAKAIPITYSLKLTSTGLLTFGYYYNGGAYHPVITNQNIATSNGPIPASFLFGFGGSTGGSENVHEITCFRATPLSSNTSATSNSVQSGQLNTGTQLYIASYYADNWWGSLAAVPLIASGTGSSATVSVGSTANWDGGCVLTGGSCQTTGVSSMTAESPSSRVILTSSASGAGGGAAFEWGSLPTGASTAFTAEATAISTTITGQDILNWLRGTRTEEQGASPAGPLRTRTGVLGDILDSSPVAVGPPNAPYGATWYDILYGLSGQSPYLPENAPGAATYTNFSSFGGGTGQYGSRANVVYDGSNDGMLHGFRSGSFTCNPATSTNPNSCYSTSPIPNDGLEVLAYVPGSLAASSTNNVDALTNPIYNHAYYVDASPQSGDVFYNGNWHTLLGGGMGTGGAGVYLLDITNPAQFSETNSSALVLGEWTPSSISCANDTTTSSCSSSLGQLWGKPAFTRLHNGKWAMIFGNGHNSSTGHAGIYIGVLNQGSVTFYYLDTGSGSTTTPNGIDYVSPADLDGDYTTDFIYAGDLLGHVWRFNVTSNNPADWAASRYGNNAPTPLYTAVSSTSTLQPISTQVQVAETSLAGNTYVLVMFGTGEATPATNTSGVQYASGTQAVYGIWDWDMSNWNNGYLTASTLHVPGSIVQLAALTPTAMASTVSPASSLTTSNLVQQTITDYGTSRTLSNNPFCPAGSNTCISGNNEFGWYVNLPDNNGQSPALDEQLVYNPITYMGLLFMNTTIPPGGSVINCSPQIPTGWTMAFDIQNGGAPPSGVFMAGGGYGAGTSGVNGELSNGTGSPNIFNYGGNTYLVTQTSAGSQSNLNGVSNTWMPGYVPAPGCTGTNCTTTCPPGTANCTGGAPINTPNIYVGKRVNWEILR